MGGEDAFSGSGLELWIWRFYLVWLIKTVIFAVMTRKPGFALGALKRGLALGSFATGFPSLKLGCRTTRLGFAMGALKRGASR